MTKPIFTPPNVLISTAKSGNIPTETATLVIKSVMNGSAVMQLAQYEEMTTLKKNFSYMRDGIGAYWVDEAERIETSKAEWGTATIEAKKLGVIVPASREFLTYTAADFFEAIKPLIAEAFAKKFDQAALWGNGSPFGAAQNIWNDITTSGNTIQQGSTTNLYTDLNALLSLVEESDADPNGFTTTRRLRQPLRGTVDGNGRPIFNDPGAGATNQILGLGVGYADKASWDYDKATLITGDWDYARYGILEDIKYAISEEATISTIVDQNNVPINLFERDMMAIRATMMVGFMRLKDGVFAALTPPAETP